MGEILDPERMSIHLAPHLEPGARVVGARVVSPAPTERTVIEYRTGGPEAPAAFYGKVYSEAKRADRLMALLHQLGAHGVRVPRPLAHLPELRLVVFSAVPGRTLDQLEEWQRGPAAFATGRWLADLHRIQLNLDRGLDLDMEVRNAGEWARMAIGVRPSLAPDLVRLVDRLDSLKARVRVDDGVPIHKDFHYGHTLYDSGQVEVIDLDEVRAGDPAFDIAHFAANLRLLAIREEMSGDDQERLESAFMDGYRLAVPYEPDLRYELFFAYTCIKIAKQLARGRGPEPVPTGQERSRQLDLIVAEGVLRAHRL